MAFVRKFRKAKMSQNYYFCKISARQNSEKMLNIHQKTRQLPKEITEKSSGNHGEKFRKSRQLLEEITEKSSRNHGNFLRKSRRKVQEITATS